MRARSLRVALAGAALATLALASGCSYLPPVPDSMKVAAAAHDTAGAEQVPVPEPRAAATAQVDSMPSAEAAEVLATIPEPLKPSERIPAPRRAAFPAGTTAAVLADSLFGAAPDTALSADGALPVPAPTKPLGDEPGTLGVAALADSLFAPATAAAPAAPNAAAPGATSATPAAPDTCFKVQFTAPADKKTADLKRKAAESMLFVPCVVTLEVGLYKVRSRDCMNRSAADALQTRARASGFDGAFKLVDKRP